jgi:hypothetical protein
MTRLDEQQIEIEELQRRAVIIWDLLEQAQTLLRYEHVHSTIVENVDSAIEVLKEMNL